MTKNAVVASRTIVRGLGLLAWLCGTCVHADWPQFRGAGGQAQFATKLPEDWSGSGVQRWRAEVPGRGWSSPVVVGDRVYLTAVENDQAPAARKGLYIQNLQGKVVPGTNRWLLLCYGLNDGKLRWQKTVLEGKANAPIHIKNTYASETPACDGKRLFVYFGNVGLFAYDLEGKFLWKAEPGTFPMKLGWGTGSSPVVHDGRVYIQHDNEKASFLAAYDAGSGKELFKVPRDEKSSWATPFVWENSQRTEVVTCASGKVRSYDTAGKLLWEMRGMSVISIPSPSATRDRLFISSGYILDLSRPVYAIRPGARGDITLKKGEKKNDHIAWKLDLAGAYHPSPVLYDGRLYVLYDRGFFACFDAATGEEVYPRQRLDPARDKFTASPVAADGKIFVVSEDGDVLVLQAGPRFEVLAKRTLADEMCLATPALVEGGILIRSDRALYRLGK